MSRTRWVTSATEDRKYSSHSKNKSYNNFIINFVQNIQNKKGYENISLLEKYNHSQIGRLSQHNKIKSISHPIGHSHSGARISKPIVHAIKLPIKIAIPAPVSPQIKRCTPNGHRKIHSNIATNFDVLPFSSNKYPHFGQLRALSATSAAQL